MSCRRGLRKEISGLEKRIQEISDFSMADILNIYTPANVLSNEVRNNKFLVFMLRRGYINERYEHYINYFKGNSITLGDLKFIHSIKYQTPLAFSYSLSKERKHQIIRKIKMSEFGERAALNFDLMEHMLSTNEYDTQLEIYVGQLALDNKDNWRFIDEFIDITQQQRRFIKLLSSKWDGFWDDVYENYALTYERKVEYLRFLCLYCDLETLVNLNSNGNIRDFLLNDENILQYFPEKMVSRLIDLIKGLNLTFSKINIESVSEAVLDYIFDNGYYQINLDMIRSLVEYKNERLVEQLSNQNYTVILELKYTPVLNQIEKNMTLYIDDVILSECNTDERADAIIDLLKHIIKDDERCEKVIIHQKCVFKNIKDVCYDLIDTEEENVFTLWDMLLKHKKVTLCWENIYQYWESFGLTETLISYISENVYELNCLDSSILDDEFKNEIIFSNLENKVFQKLAQCFKTIDTTFSLNEIAKDRLATMIQWHYFDFELSTYEELLDCAPELCVEFILENQEAFAEHMEDINLENDSFKELVLSKKCSLELKERIILAYGEELMSYEVATQFAQGNLGVLKINKRIFETVWEVLENTKQQERLLFNYLDILGAKEFEKYLPDLDNPYCNLERREKRHEELIANNDKNLALAKRLEKIQYITSYKVEPPSIFYFGGAIRCRVKAK